MRVVKLMPSINHHTSLLSLLSGISRSCPRQCSFISPRPNSTATLYCKI
ncbi:hypothetical protein CAEBREN_30566 [Caenorhabditis brenneri]|uniref:Uncharacterized protein n=1 Tax=Caenorhabditis brenneri TaxID=135651 RepID=G0P8A3_CAEBE|nr:hypothetical protein CAEBREN_30566 [Caenorhabditis brenneri]